MTSLLRQEMQVPSIMAGSPSQLQRLALTRFEQNGSPAPGSVSDAIASVSGSNAILRPQLAQLWFSK
jgi:hypothetical protein